MDVMYTAVGHATGDGRNGHVHTDDGTLDLDVRIPKEMGGPGGGTNPEELFALGYSACFHSAIKFTAMSDKLDTTDSEVSATVGIGFAENGGSGSRSSWTCPSPTSTGTRPAPSSLGPTRSAPTRTPRGATST
jgi:osmotically inducible protein OsmC